MNRLLFPGFSAQRWLLYGLVALALTAFGALAAVLPVAGADESIAVRTDAETAGELGLLLGEGNGLTAEYLNKSSTRLQAAIISLRLSGTLQEALDYDGSNHFADASQVNEANRAVLAYLKDHPERGWQGTGGNRFEPLAPISSQQFYKVLLENLGFRSGTDFAYADTESFAASKGLGQISGTGSITNAHIATALVESLNAETAAGVAFFSQLQTAGVISNSATIAGNDRIMIAHHPETGDYFTDGEGRTLYWFANDTNNVQACQGQCLVNWPIFYSDSLDIPAFLEASDFGAFVRDDGSKQITYKGWPLYYFLRDAAAGDIAGEGVGGVWFVAGASLESRTGGEAQPTEPAQPETKTYRVDIKQFSFGTEALTVEAGSTVIFTNFDDMEHNAVAENGAFSSPLLAKGESYSIVLDEPGTYEYYCEPHRSFMTGTIIVQ